MLQWRHILRRQYEARAASVEMDVQTVLTRIGRPAVVSIVVVMVAGIAVMMIALFVVV
jgi:hypothetical protein